MRVLMEVDCVACGATASTHGVVQEVDVVTRDILGIVDVQPPEGWHRTRPGVAAFVCGPCRSRGEAPR